MMGTAGDRRTASMQKIGGCEDKGEMLVKSVNKTSINNQQMRVLFLFSFWSLHQYLS